MDNPVIIGDATLYHADCRDILPALEGVDCVVTDPPYGYGKPSGTIGALSTKRDYESFEDTVEKVRNICIPAFEQALKLSGGRAIITPGNACAFYYPVPDCMGSFYQPAAVGMSRWGRETSQPILYYGDDPRLGKTIDNTSYKLVEKNSCSEHPCAKPLNAWTWIVNRASLENQTILDPFMGSGTTGVACARLGRKFIGIEIEKKYFDIACERIDREYSQGKLFNG
jgi:DNA modification methylase